MKYNCDNCNKIIEIHNCNINRYENHFCNDKCYKEYRVLKVENTTDQRRNNLIYNLRTIGYNIDSKKQVIFICDEEFNYWNKFGVEPRIKALQWFFGFIIKLN